MRLAPWALAVVLATGPRVVHGQHRLTTETDRAAFAAWFVLLTDAQFYRTTADVTDCAALVRHAVREALRPHTAEWMRLARLPLPQVAPDIVERPQASGDALPLFLVAAEPRRYAEFADARTIVRLNARLIGRDVGAARPGDLLYFHQPGQALPDHLMVFVGPSALAPEAFDWVVYHTGPDPGERPGAAAAETTENPAAPRAEATGEVRKVRLADLLQHPAPRWRPVAANGAFVGVFRLHFLS